MDLDNISKLSDNQLVALYRNPIITPEVKKNILNEIEQRDVDATKNLPSEDVSVFTAKDTLYIFFFSPILVGSVIPFIIFHHFYLKNWNKPKYKHFWKYTTLGVVFYTILLFAWLHFSNN